jgi:hypothetical protein
VMDLIIRNARLADRSSAELCDIGVGNGRIVAIKRRLAAGGRTLGVVRLRRWGERQSAHDGAGAGERRWRENARFELRCDDHYPTARRQAPGLTPTIRVKTRVR